MSSKEKQTIPKLLTAVAINLFLTATIVLAVVGLLSRFYHVELRVSSLSLILAIIGTTLAFAGNNFVADALGRWGSHALPQFHWGNSLQAIGFALTLVALLIK